MNPTLHGIGDVVAYVPYSLGYVPDGLVLVGMCDCRVGVIARLDRPPPTEAADAARCIAEKVSRSSPDDVIVLCYDDFGPVGRLFCGELRARLRVCGADVSHLVDIRSGACWRAEQCGCGNCPREWAPVPPAAGVAPVAERVLRGVAPVAHRSDLEHRFELRHPEVAAAVEACIGSSPGLGEGTAFVLPRVLLDTVAVHTLPVTVLAGATVAVSSVQVRDEILSWLMPDFMSGELGPVSGPVDPHHLGLPPVRLRELEPFTDPVELVTGRLEEWIGCIPTARSVPVLVLLAGISWTVGSGVIASMALDHALRLEPGYRLARLMATAVAAGLRPVRPEGRPA
ncbi:DUF4192 domain-containing protein [Flexivirga caeni]|uniref:DUF4192 family protein n=1 Tax=Flexivirga caeni TaxID=2294115 RepID=A0A3M9M520_9MICO|nr:DUF4192 domain-containing protein [Flexivirga caeni]RNI20265.1 DUF4192 family protein [Flexivirga caeni]